jgi:hypothetical protein
MCSANHLPPGNDLYCALWKLEFREIQAMAKICELREFRVFALPQARSDPRTPPAYLIGLGHFCKCRDEPTYWSRWEKRQLARTVRLTSIGS